MPKPKIPSERPPVTVEEDRWDISDDPAPSLSAPIAPSSLAPSDPDAPASSTSFRAHDPLCTTLALGNDPFAPPSSPTVPSAGAGHRTPPSAPGSVGAHREATLATTLALESKALREMLVANATEAIAARATSETANATPSAAPPSAGVPATGQSAVLSTTLVLDGAPLHKGPSSTALPAHSPPASKSEHPARATMVFSPRERVKAASDERQARLGASTLVLDPNAPAQPPVTQGPPAAGRMGAVSAHLSKTMIQGVLPSSAPVAAASPSQPSSDATVSVRETLVMAAPLATKPAHAALAASQGSSQPITRPSPDTPADEAVPHGSVPKDAVSRTIVGTSHPTVSIPSASTVQQEVPAHAAKAPTAAAEGARMPLESLAKTLVGTPPIAALTDAVSLQKSSQSDSTNDLGSAAVGLVPAASERALDPTRSSALSTPAACTTETLADSSSGASARTMTTPHALVVTEADERSAQRETDQAALNGNALRERAKRHAAPLVQGEGALRVVLAAAGAIVVLSAVPMLLRDLMGAATWTIPGVIALVLAVIPVGHATRALLAFAPALPALAVRAMSCEGHSVLGAFALTVLATGLPAALLFRAYFAGIERARAFVVVALVIGLLWVLLPGGGGMLGPSTGSWAVSHVPALSFLVLAALSVTALLQGRFAGRAGASALIAMVWTALPALGSRAEQWGLRALDALSFVGLSAIASSTFAALLSVYALPEKQVGRA